MLLWDANSQSRVGVGRGHIGGIGAVVFSKKSHNFFVSGMTAKVKVAVYASQAGIPVVITRYSLVHIF